MDNNDSSKEDGSKISYWNTLPGILTGLAGVIGAIGALVAGLNQAGLIGKREPTAPSPVSSTPATLKPGLLTISATGGNYFTNPMKEAKKIMLQATGEWSGIAEKDSRPLYTSPQGYRNQVCDQRCWCPQYALGALVAIRSAECIEIGEGKIILLGPEQEINIFMNDYRDGYADNVGQLEVKWAYVE
jgi:hypothetical protein